uniref:Uncharacterized protein n=1 Tax=Moniliophthora roreri TaxID=221103 RepID=A0A0W0EVC6_MONRR
MSMDTPMKEYTLLAHNCFFFLGDHFDGHLPALFVIQYAGIRETVEHFDEVLPSIVKYIVDKVENLFLNLVVSTVTMFTDEADKRLYWDLMPVALLPTSVLWFFCLPIFHARLHFGLRDQLGTRLKRELKTRAADIAQDALQHHNVLQVLAQRLWLRKMDKLVGPVIMTEIIDIM